MALSDDLASEVKGIFKYQWDEVAGRAVPTDEDLTFRNECRLLNATVLYADLDESTKLVDSENAHFAAEVYKAYLRCASKIVLSEGGAITAFDGDRIMAVFLGADRNRAATRTALKLNFARVKIINPAIAAQYGAGKYTVKHVVGIDASPLHVVKSGVRGSNDLVWVGRAANHAAKLCTLPADHSSRITEDVFNDLGSAELTSSGKPMWEKVTWNAMGRSIYRSTWMWTF